jgi:hypothetical protein
VKYFLTILFLFSFTVNAKTIRVGVVDSGMPNFDTNLKVCPNGVYDLTHTDVYDKIGHSTNILGIISNGLKDIDYCAVVIKVYDENSADTTFITHLIAYLYLYYLHVDVVNYSSVGAEDEGKAEEVLIKGMISRGVKFVAAAGNHNVDLDKNCSAFPACIPGVISVGNLKSDGARHSSSNYGKIVKVWQIGVNVCANNICYTGTSQATAKQTIEEVKKLIKERR